MHEKDDYDAQSHVMNLINDDIEMCARKYNLLRVTLTQIRNILTKYNDEIIYCGLDTFSISSYKKQDIFKVYFERDTPNEKLIKELREFGFEVHFLIYDTHYLDSKSYIIIMLPHEVITKND